MNEIPEEVSTDEATKLLVALTRLEGKIDLILAQHSADIGAHRERLDDHERRLRTVEQTPTVSPAKLWTAVCTAAGLIVSILTFVSPLL